MAVQHSYGKMVTDGLVLYLNAADANSYVSGSTTWKDLAGSNNGTLVNGPTYNSANYGSIVFDGVDDYVECGATPNLTGLINTSISCWAYPVTSSGITIFASRYYNTNANQGWLLTYVNSKFSFDGRESSAAYLQVTSSNTYAVNNWYNVTATKSGSLWSIYVNGSLQGSTNQGNGTTPFASNNMQLGTAFYSLFQPNRIATTQIYNRALSASEVLQNYNATKARFGLT